MHLDKIKIEVHSSCLIKPCVKKKQFIDLMHSKVYCGLNFEGERSFEFRERS